MALTNKQEKFCLNISKGMTQADAYRNSYDCEASSNECIATEASLLMDNPNITQRVAELKEKVSEYALYDAKKHYDELEQLKNIALTPSGDKGIIDVKAAIKATELKGKLTGLYVERSIVQIDTPEKILSELEDEPINSQA